MRTYDLRFERTGQPKIDIQRGEASLDMARLVAEEWYRVSWPDTSESFDWRGAVCFVDCVPAEEVRGVNRR